MSETLAGYHIKDQLYKSRSSLVCRGRQGETGRLVVLKLLNQAYPSPRRIASLQREYDLLRSLSSPGVICAYDLAFDQHRPVLVLEDFGGESLTRALRATRLSLGERLSLAVQIAECVERLHQQHVIHKDINPSNIVWNPQTGQLKLIDFGIATRLDHETPALQSLARLEGTLAYMSPEQTGRMNRNIDYRTDLYSLGVTLYELLTDRLPFPTSDALALVHAHIAQPPPPLQAERFAIPPLLSAIVMKLMAKTAEERYQSASGLIADLQECLRQWTTTGSVAAFPLGQQDVTGRFQLSQKLYGRGPAVNALTAAFLRVRQGSSELMLVSGQAGVGKTALVQELYKSLTPQRERFVAGKFDQLQRNIPYASLTQAFRSLIQQILTESEEQLGRWRKALTAAVGANLQVVIDVIPEVELIVGPQPAAPQLPPIAGQNRFRLVFQNFLRAFIEPNHPLVLFLDDLQWADAASLALLRFLMTDPENHGLFVICAYRDTEVAEGHPLRLTIEEIRKEGGTVSVTILEPLHFPEVQQFIADTLNCPVALTRPLAEVVFSKTAGNPFFIAEFLKSLSAARLLDFDSQACVWRWDVAAIQAQNITDNVVELMAEKMQKLSGETLELLKLASCLGGRFALDTVALIAKRPRSEALDLLWPAITAGLVAPLRDGCALATLGDLAAPDFSENDALEYKFAHDRIQQAAYSLISQADKPALHWRLGRSLLTAHSPEQGERELFTVVNHFNLGREAIRTGAERNELAGLNLKAGQKAKAAAAYGPAYGYFQTGIELLAEEAWKRQYVLTLTLHLEAAEASYLNGDFLHLERFTTAVLRNARELIDKVKAYEVLLHACSAQNKLVEGTRTGLQVLQLLGEEFPAAPNSTDSARGFRETQQLLAGRPAAELLRLPTMRDAHALAAMHILSGLLHLSFAAFPQLFPLIVFRMVRLSVTRGNSPLSAQAYATYGITLCGAVGDIETGYRFGGLALQLMERFGARELKAGVTYMVQTFIRHWKEHLSVTLQPLLEGYQIGLETGDLMFGALDAQGYCFQSYWLGAELGGLEQEMKAYSEVMRRHKQEQALNINEIYRQMVLNLLGRSTHPCRLVGESYNEEVALPLRLQANDVNTLCFVFSSKLVLSYLFYEYQQALDHAARAEEYLDSLVGTAAIPAFHFYDSLARLAVFSETPEDERPRLRGKVAANQEKLRLWAQHAPMNHQHKFALVEAERARVMGHDRDAREYYDQAIDLAREHGYVNEEALANELAARFYFAKGRDRLAQHYLQDAHYAYLRWGALAKVKDLETRYPQLLAHPNSSLSQFGGSMFTISAGQRLSSAFDFASILNASQAISREIRLDKLLTQLMRLVIETAGAQRGLLLLEKDGRLVVAAEQLAAHAEVVVQQAAPLDTYPDAPATVLHYVARTRESLMLNDATQEKLFAHDLYIVQKRPKSILCAPILAQDQPLGVIYLENNAATAVFTPERLEVVRLLASQAAISIKNADLYQSVEAAKQQLEDANRMLELKIEERTQEIQRRNRELEIASAQVQEATRRKSQFLAGMSHQLRTPMNAILGFTRLVLRRAGDLVPERQRENLIKVKESADNLLNLINQLLDLSKIEAGRMELHPALFEVTRCILSCCETVAPLVKAGVRLRQEIAAEVDKAYTDEDGLRQIVLNLLSNAIKFTESGEVAVRVRLEEQTSGAAWLVIAVADTGVGVPADELGAIFEEFQQVEGGVLKREGTGLGLPIAKRWVELLQGSIAVESEPGKGSTFTVRIPVVYREQEPLTESMTQ